MKISTFSKIILLTISTVCFTVTGVGCGRSLDSSASLDTSDNNSTLSSTQSTTDTITTESTDNTSADLTSLTDESANQTTESTSPTSEQQSQTDNSTSQTDKSENKVKKDNEENSSNIVVMLDPGHDEDERDQPQLGVNEQELNLKIGLACYDRLSEYKGVTPYLTRYDRSCPNADGQFSGEYDCIHKRAYLAEEKNANIFVSLHCNATTGELGAEANGISVYITNYPEFTSECEKLGNLIINHVTKTVDLGSRGVILSDLDENKGYYKDGSIKDKYYLLSYNIDYDRPAIIVEHAFMDNIHDNAILKDDEQLKLMGQADADAIAEYYGLELK